MRVSPPIRFRGRWRSLPKGGLLPRHRRPGFPGHGRGGFPRPGGGRPARQDQLKRARFRSGVSRGARQ